MSLLSWARKTPVSPVPTRNQRFRAVMRVLHGKSKTGSSASNYKRQQTLQKRREFVAGNADAQELLDWILEIQRKLKLNNEFFARELGISTRMLIHYRKRSGHLPSERVFARLLELERLTRAEVVVTKKLVTFNTSRIVHTIYVE